MSLIQIRQIKYTALDSAFGNCIKIHIQYCPKSTTQSRINKFYFNRFLALVKLNKDKHFLSNDVPFYIFDFLQNNDNLFRLVRS